MWIEPTISWSSAHVLNHQATPSSCGRDIQYVAILTESNYTHVYSNIIIIIIY